MRPVGPSIVLNSIPAEDEAPAPPSPGWPCRWGETYWKVTLTSPARSVGLLRPALLLPAVRVQPLEQDHHLHLLLLLVLLVLWQSGGDAGQHHHLWRCHVVSVTASLTAFFTSDTPSSDQLKHLLWKENKYNFIIIPYITLFISFVILFFHVYPNIKRELWGVGAVVTFGQLVEFCCRITNSKWDMRHIWRSN